jgi:cytochrome P450
LIEQLRDGQQPLDLNKGYFEPFIVGAVALSAGITLDESHRLYAFSNRVLVRVENPEDEARISRAWCELYDYSGDLVNRKLANPDDGLLSKVIAEFYTPYGILSVCAVELFRYPEVVEACKKEPGLWEPVTEELMRYKAHFNFFLPRVATEDVSLGGEKITAGQVLLPSLHAAVTDPNLFTIPHVVNTRRVQSRCNIVFGAGPHFCLGAALSRQWLQVSLELLFITLPGLRLLQSYNDLEWLAGSISMPKRIIVIWD